MESTVGQLIHKDPPMTPERLAELTLEVAGLPWHGNHLIDEELHKAFNLPGAIPLLVTGRIDHTIRLVRTALPNHGYQITLGPAPQRRDLYVAKIFAPPKNPDGALTDSDSWSQHFEGGGDNEAKALLIAFLRAAAHPTISTNPMVG